MCLNKDLIKYKKICDNWPCYSNFSKWKAPLNIYMELCDEIPYYLCNNEMNAEKFRKYVDCYFNDKKYTAYYCLEILKESNEEIKRGVLVAITYISHSYRWGHIPIIYEHNTNQFELPIHLTLLWDYLNKYNGIKNNVGCVFSMVLCNYWKEKDKMRFNFNYNQNLINTENNFFLIFVHMEIKGKYLYQNMIQCIDLMIKNEEEKSLNEIKSISIKISNIIKIFNIELNYNNINKNFWYKYVSPITSWDHNNMLGPSGSQSLIIQMMDSFLNINGISYRYNSNLSNRNQMSNDMRYLIETIEKYSIVREYCKKNNILKDIYNEIIDKLILWRLSHRHKASKYIENSKYTASGIVESNKKSNNIIEEFKNQMTERIKEIEDFKI